MNRSFDKQKNGSSLFTSETAKPARHSTLFDFEAMLHYYRQTPTSILPGSIFASQSSGACPPDSLPARPISATGRTIDICNMFYNHESDCRHREIQLLNDFSDCRISEIVESSIGSNSILLPLLSHIGHVSVNS